jgi:hypothetical protein
MNPLFALAFVFAQAASPPPPKPWHGTLAQGLAEVRRLSEADKTDEALAVAEQLLAPNGFARWRERATEKPGWKKTVVETAGPVFEAVGLSDLAPAERASVQFARGVALARAEKRAESDEAFEKARALAGPGELRLDATYDLGWTALEEGEKLRAKIPELNAGAAAVPSAPNPAAANPAGPDPTAPDPLDLARAAYQKARERFVGTLKANAKDEDARANVELAQKRLRELAEIQKKREEEKKKQDQQKKDDQKKDDQKKDQDKKDQDKQDQKKDSSSDDKDKKKPDEQPKDDKPKDDKDKKDQPKDEESDKDKKEKKPAQPQQSQEQQLTKEEVMRLLDTLKDREEEGKKLLEQLRRARRAKVKRDW